MEGPKYAVGDKVTIKRTRKGSSNDYRFSFTDAMLEYGGKEFTIESVNKASGYTRSPVPDDGYSYKLVEVGFTWASSMFEDTIESESINIDAFISKKKCPVLDFTLH